MDCRIKSTVISLVFLLFSQITFASNLSKTLTLPNDIYIGLSGGYGQSQQAYENTGLSSLLRIDFGSLWEVNKWHINNKLLLGTELGFQTGNQIRLNKSIVETNGNLGVPVYLNTKTPIDMLFVAKWVFYKSFFVEAKGGAAYITSQVTGGDVQTNNSWLPELQTGFGLGLSRHSRVVLAYQRYFGKKVKITSVDPIEGISLLSGIPTWQAFLLTIEIKV